MGLRCAGRGAGSAPGRHDRRIATKRFRRKASRARQLCSSSSAARCAVNSTCRAVESVVRDSACCWTLPNQQWHGHKCGSGLRPSAAVRTMARRSGPKSAKAADDIISGSVPSSAALPCASSKLRFTPSLQPSNMALQLFAFSNAAPTPVNGRPSMSGCQGRCAMHLVGAVVVPVDA